MAATNNTTRISELEKNLNTSVSDVRTLVARFEHTDRSVNVMIEKFDKFVDEYHKTEKEKLAEREVDRKRHSPSWLQIILAGFTMVGVSVGYIQFTDNKYQRQIEQTLAPYVQRIDEVYGDVKELNTRVRTLENATKK